MELFFPMLKSALVLSLFLGVYQLFLKQDTHFSLHRWFLLSGIAVSFILPFLIFETVVQKELPAELLISQGAENFSPDAEETAMVSWITIGLYSYLIIVAAFFIRMLIQIGGLLHLLKDIRSIRKGTIVYHITNRSLAPFSFFNHIVYNPEQHSKAEVQMILAHETAHARQFHSIDILIANLLVCLQWFNPFAWIYRKSIMTNLEYLADRESISVAPSPKTYQLAMVKNALPLSTPALASTFYQSNIKKRIIMLNKNSSNRFHKFKIIAILPLLAVFFWSFNVKERVEWNSIETNTSDNTPTTVSEIGGETASTEPNTTTSSKIEKEAATNEKVSSISKNEEPVSTAVQETQEIVHVTITKNSSDADLDQMKRMLLDEHKVEFDYKKVKRNAAGEIIGIRIVVEDEFSGNKSQYHTSSDSPINDIHIIRKANGGLSIGNLKSKAEANASMEEVEQKMAERREEMEIRRKEMEERRVEMEVEREERRRDMREEMRARREAMRDEMGMQRDSLREERIRVRRGAMDDSVRIIRNKHRNVQFGAGHISDNGQPLIVVDGKVRERDALQEILPEQIESVNVIKGKKAVDKYGPKAMDGVIEIKTKN
ncbi:M56 family metallopeptidase [Luteirhabdus pelagi]|jgi:hypothetical protein|uniref:M56 family metallopeptidase n=1 Tax=Luteirhabdus pelagi TaxID=2792783 RepID=UPI00193A06DC|nr:M56 family metallopeptidase [Luteirhabdus pelagi]